MSCILSALWDQTSHSAFSTGCCVWNKTGG